MVLKQTFVSFKIYNFRVFIIGQGISMIGTWMQTIGLAWLVLQISHSGTTLGFVVALQFLPILFFGMYGGLVADRFNKRKILFITQFSFSILALILGSLVLEKLITINLIYLFAILFGLVNTIDNPTRQSFVIEMVGRDKVRNAVTLNSTMVNSARVIGPSIAGILIATLGIGACFIANGLSYFMVLLALYLMRSNELYPAEIKQKTTKQIRIALKYVLSQPKLKTTLIIMFIIGTFAYEFPVIYPLVAIKTFHGNAGTYAAMMTSAGLGAIVGSIYTASRKSTEIKQLLTACFLFGLSIIIASLMPTIITLLVSLFIVGGLSIVFIALGNSLLQIEAAPQMRGRVMSLWTIAFLGTTPIGGPIIGYIADHFSPRLGLATGGISAIIAAYVGYLVFKNTSKPVTTAN